MKTTPSIKRRLGVAALTLPLLAGSTLAFAQSATPPAPPAPRTAAVNELRDMNDLRLEGRVAEVFGNRFVLEDATGRTLVELGPRAERGDLVKVGDTVSVDGRFTRGQIDARSISVGGGERIALERRAPSVVRIVTARAVPAVVPIARVRAMARAARTARRARPRSVPSAAAGSAAASTRRRPPRR